MVVKALVSVEEYLDASFPSPVPDYVEGELVERAVPNTFHSRIQVNLSDVFQPWEKKGVLVRATEIRLRLGERQFRVADFAVFVKVQQEPIPEDLPYAIVEIVSPDDRYEELMSKMADYEVAGVEYLFVADPTTKRLSRYRRGDLINLAALEMPGVGVLIPVPAIFASL